MTNENAIFICKFLVPLLLAVVACVFDLRERRIPNAIAITLLATGLVFSLATGGWNGLLNSIGGFAAGFSILMILYLVGAGGAGDVKFMGGVGAWIGPYHILFVFVLSAILLAVFAILVFLFRLLFSSVETLREKSHEPESSKKSPLRTPIPYAVPAAAAILIRLGWLLLIGRTS